jgi:hypothetical protein
MFSFQKRFNRLAFVYGLIKGIVAVYFTLNPGLFILSVLAAGAIGLVLLMDLSLGLFDQAITLQVVTALLMMPPVLYASKTCGSQTIMTPIN